MPGGYVDESGKWEFRRRLVAARRAVPAAVREREAAALAAMPLPGLPGTVCAYWPVGAEPGSPELLDGLVRRGCQVLLPVVISRGPLDWAQYTGPGLLQVGPLGLLEPTGSRLGSAAIATAVLVLVPALAVDRAGVRLGRGGGHYDRTLPLATPGTPLVAIVRDDEVLAALPAQPHDVPVTAALTPARGLIPLPY
ncbi:MAG: 5-formyltetrahydrofolate cyclo-ligase [Pseudonocardiaceae bacterium]|jgi:5-formyltetrahydrofolate cyclo-ligase|nr:5-formyltetrahydrofolate cyclo-ligase [Pseudonocardiaceae bacterium]